MGDSSKQALGSSDKKGNKEEKPEILDIACKDYKIHKLSVEKLKKMLDRNFMM